MQYKNPFIDNLSKVMADAFGAAHSAKNEAENVFKTWLDGWLAERDFVTREIFNKILDDTEEHIDWIESQKHLIESAGLQNYLQEQISEENG